MSRIPKILPVNDISDTHCLRGRKVTDKKKRDIIEFIIEMKI